MRTLWKVILGILIGLGVLVVLSIIVLFYGLNKLETACDEYYYNVPLKANVSGLNLVLKPLNTIPEMADILIITKEKVSEIPNNCSLDNIRFDFGQPGVIFKDSSLSIQNGSRGSYGNLRYALIEYPHPNSQEIILHLRDDSSFKKTEKLISSGKEEMHIEYSMSPFFNENELGYYSNYPKKDIDIYGCIVLRRNNATIQDELEIKEVTKNVDLKPKQIICLMNEKYAHPNEWDFSNEDCTFFEISSDIYISTEIDLSKGSGQFIKRSCF